MSVTTTPFRPFARVGWGGQAASHFRGAASRGAASPDRTLIYRSPGASANTAILGVTRDSTGSALGSCVVELFQTGGEIITAKTVSDAAGAFRFDQPGSGPFFLVAYKPGSPDLAGTTVNTLIAV